MSEDRSNPTRTSRRRRSLRSKRWIDEPIHWGDFMAFTRLPRIAAVLVEADPVAHRLVVDTGDERLVLDVGGADDRFARTIDRLTHPPVPLVRWDDSFVVGLPIRDGHGLFRARSIPPGGEERADGE